MAKTTASASGTKRNFATPVRKNIGTKTMQMQMVETKAGTAICGGAIENRLLHFLALRQVAFDVLDFDGGVVDQDSDGEGKTAQGHDVDGLAQRAEQEDRNKDRERDRDTR